MVMMLGLSLVVGSLAAAPAMAAKPMSVQARFDAANAAADARRCDEAIPAYEELERAPAIVRNPLARATIAVRKGACLVRRGRVVEGEAAIRAGLPTLEGKGAEFADDRRDARLALASAAQMRFDYDAAVGEAEKALALSTGFARVPPLLVLSSLTMFDGDGRGLRYAEDARQTIAGEKSATKKDVAAVQTQAARAMLNAGRTKEAYALLKDSLAKQGGLGTRIHIDDVATRSDLVIAALLTGDKDSAREYLAYTGAGRISQAPFASAWAMDPPTCDPAIGLKPGDVAVVEFSLAEDGRVVSAVPIYVTGNRAAAVAFARAVTNWSWKAEQAKAVPIFYRALTRVELRCSTAADVPGLKGALLDAVNAWLFADGAPAWDDMSDAAAAPLQRAALASAKPGSRSELGALAALALNVSLSEDERRDLAMRIAASPAMASAPAAMRVWSGLGQVGLRARSRSNEREGEQALLADPVIAADPLALAVLRLTMAGGDQGMPPAKDAVALLDQVIDAPGLPEHHPLKVNALLRKANLLARAGDMAGADAAFRRTGLSTEQCAMLGVTPALRSNGASSSDFPQDAMRWGFEGWVRTEFDISADGRTAGQRALIAYPPFVFDDAATGIAKQSRWASSYRPGGSVACAASHQSVKFVMP